jgi:VIT1/CCC1 family predicted Fe2+/Mn2+ transporter
MAQTPEKLEKGDLSRYRANLQDEVDSAFLYRAIAAVEKQPQLASVYRRLAETEERHADFWEERLGAAGVAVTPRQPGWRARILAWLSRRFGAQFVLPTIVEAEQGDVAGYSSQPESRGTVMPAEERSHGRILSSILQSTPGGLEGSSIALLEGRHKAIGGNALRAAVLGADDGLVSNLSLVMGVAGANLSNHGILITGFAGLLAGSISMALGEWLSVQSSRELLKRQISIEAAELKAHPQEEREELALIYEAKGLGREQAEALAARLVTSPESALDTLAREELGVDPEELGGSAWEAAISSFCLFAVGAIVPVSPFLFLSGATAVVTSLVVSCLGLFGIGAAITLMTGRSVLFSGSRQVAFGMAAASVTFGIGKLLGVSLGG